MDTTTPSPARTPVAILPFLSQRVYEPDPTADALPVCLWPIEAGTRCEGAFDGEICDRATGYFYGTTCPDEPQFCPRHYYKMHYEPTAVYRLVDRRSATPTHGPWVFDPVHRIVYDALVKLGVDTVEATGTPEEIRANGHLIAAAPELLEALDELLAETLDQHLAQGIALSEREEYAYAKAIAALAKASGGR